MPILSNSKHEAVAQAYIADPQHVGWKAYVVVYPKSSEAAAKTAFTRLLKKADFAARIAELMAAAADSAVMSLNDVLVELSLLGRSNVKHIAAVFPHGDLGALTDEQAATIKSVVIDTYMDGAGDDAREVKRVRVELHDKRGALAELRDHHEPRKLKLEHTGKDGGPIETKDTTERNELDIARRIAFALEEAGRRLAKETST